MRILIFGSTGMLGSTIFNILSKEKNLEVYGTARNPKILSNLKNIDQSKILNNVDVENLNNLLDVFAELKPDIVINCIGLIKQLGSSKDPTKALPINSILPHQLAKICKIAGARLVHYSTDCVFSGAVGNYTEEDVSDCIDLYGKSKEIGEVKYDNTITLRTSVIGHELSSSKSLVDWFLSQETEIKGFTKAIFSGLTTIEHAKVLKDIIIPNTKLHGLYHLAVNPIDKFTLLTLIGEIYKKDIKIIPSDDLVINRSLNSTKFINETGYSPPEWDTLIRDLYNYRMNEYV